MSTCVLKLLFVAYCCIFCYDWRCLVGASLTATDASPPPEAPPPEIVPALTKQGRIPLEFFYVDDSNKGQGTHFKYSQAEIEEIIAGAKKLIKQTLSSPVPPPPPPASSTGSRVAVRMPDRWLIHALHRYPVKGQRVAVFGSMSPWYESIALAFGAASVTVIEYNKLTYNHPAVSTVQPQELQKNDTFDSMLSISSFDHDGLGRYGDPINADGDLEAMRNALSLLNPGGRMFLTVPIGPDVVVWNLHRRYGEVRLGELLRGWRRVEVIGWSEEHLTSQASWMRTYEPVHVLERATLTREEL